MADSASRPRRPPGRRNPWRALVTLLWRQALFAVPMTIFFGTLYAGGVSGFVRALKMSLVFAYVIGLALWTLEHLILPRFPGRPGESHTAGVLRVSFIYTATSILGAALAAWLIHVTIIPGFLGSGRAVAVIGMYTLLFAVLTTGIVLAVIFYRDALQRVRAEQELDLARRIQRAFLISRFPSMPRVEVHAVNVSSKQVSGDFYDVVPVGDALLLAIADVSGKGVAAALMSSMLQASLRTQAGAVHSISDMLLNMNRLLCGGVPTGKFATFFLARVDEPSLRLDYANAGHNYPLLRRADGSVEELGEGGLLLGIQDEIRVRQCSVQLAAGDSLVLYTDGISEAANERNELYGEQRLAAFLAGLPPDLPAADVADRTLASVRAHLDGVEAGDDMTLVVLRVRAEGAGAPVSG
jgi:serine phosphatase RsbU (regulator of sigma subunit)